VILVSALLGVLFNSRSWIIQCVIWLICYTASTGKKGAVRKAFKLLLIWSVACSVTLELLVQMFPGVFVALFNDKPEFTAVAVSALRIYSAGLFMFGVQCACQQTFMALGQAKVSLLMALLRKIILLIPLIYILPPFFADKTFAVLLSEPVADICAATVTGTVFFLQFPKILRRREERLKKNAT
jgi:Na+-driven multidrug efflux pump